LQFSEKKCQKAKRRNVFTYPATQYYETMFNLCTDGINFHKLHKTIILPVVLYGCETWALTLRVKHNLRVFENRVLRLFGPKRDGVMVWWRKLHNKELHNL
jgi:hypothetical protein